METIAKVISLTLLAVFGATAGVIYLADSKFSPSLLKESISNSDNYESKADSDIDLSSYRKRLLGKYVEQPSGDTLEKQKPLWTDTYDESEPTGYPTSSQEVKRLAGDSLSALREKMQYWHNQYHRALQAGQTQEANDAYRKYKNYKESLEIKRGF